MNTDGLIIRPATSADAATLVEFNLALANETEHRKLDPKIVRAGVENLLRDAKLGFYTVAEQNKRVVGALMITFEWSDWRNKTFWWIQSVYVHQDFRRRGIYRRLYDHVRGLAEQTGEVCGLRLYVEKGNLVAQQAYSQLGMSEAAYKIFEAEIGVTKL